MAKTFSLSFGSGDPRTHSGLSPTFVLFFDQNGATLASPSITEGFPSSGLYKFTYTPTLAITFLIDGATTGLISSDRYIKGVLDPVLTVDQAVVNLGSSLNAGFSLIGNTTDSFGSTSADPVTLFGYMKRALEFNEGNAVYTKSTNLWNIYSRGSSTLLSLKTLTDSQTSTTKT